MIETATKWDMEGQEPILYVTNQFIQNESDPVYLELKKLLKEHFVLTVNDVCMGLSNSLGAIAIFKKRKPQ